MEEEGEKEQGEIALRSNDALLLWSADDNRQEAQYVWFDVSQISAIRAGCDTVRLTQGLVSPLDIAAIWGP